MEVKLGAEPTDTKDFVLRARSRVRRFCHLELTVAGRELLGSGLRPAASKHPPIPSSPDSMITNTGQTAGGGQPVADRAHRGLPTNKRLPESQTASSYPSGRGTGDR